MFAMNLAVSFASSLPCKSMTFATELLRTCAASLTFIKEWLEVNVIISQLPQHFELPLFVILAQLSHMLPEKIFSIVPQTHCFATAIATVEQIVSDSFDKMRWIRKEIHVTIRLCLRGMNVEGFVANFLWITMQLIQTLVGECVGALSLVDAATFRRQFCSSIRTASQNSGYISSALAVLVVKNPILFLSELLIPTT